MNKRAKIDFSGGAFLCTGQQAIENANKQGLYKAVFKFDADYNPDITRNDVIPREEDYIDIPFRLLSATIVAADGRRATEFPEAVLRASADKLVNVRVLTDHWDYNVLDTFGIIKSTKWTPATTDESGNRIPAGIDGIMRFDMKLQYAVIRQIYNGEINSCSVSVEFMWEPNMALPSNIDFDYAVGTEYEGQLVRRVATEIIGYSEVSLVGMGADPFAKRLKENGTPNNPEWTAVAQYAKNVKELNQLYNTDKGTELINEFGFYYVDDRITNKQAQTLTLSLTKQGEILKKEQTEQAMDKKIIECLVRNTGITEAELNENSIEKWAETNKQANESLQAKINELQTEVQSSKEALAKVESEKAELSKLAAQTTQRVENVRKQVMAFHNLKTDNKPNEAIVKTIETAGLELLEAFASDWGMQLHNEFGAKCVECGSTQITHRQTDPEPTGQTSDFGALVQQLIEAGKKEDPIEQTIKDLQKKIK